MAPVQPPPTPDMSPIVRPEPIEISMPCFPMSKNKLSATVDKTQELFLSY